jgi:hypothetical protein
MLSTGSPWRLADISKGASNGFYLLLSALDVSMSLGNTREWAISLSHLVVQVLGSPFWYQVLLKLPGKLLAR